MVSRLIFSLKTLRFLMVSHRSETTDTCLGILFKFAFKFWKAVKGLKI